MAHANVPLKDWKKVKREIQKTWTRIAAHEIENTEGNFASLSSLIQIKYGLTEDEAVRKLDEIISRSQADSKSDSFHNGSPVKSKEPGIQQIGGRTQDVDTR